MKRYLITGGTGMVGRALVEQLTRSNEAIIYILTRSDQTSQQQHVHYINWSKDGWEEEVPHIDIVINLARCYIEQTLDNATSTNYDDKSYSSDTCAI